MLRDAVREQIGEEYADLPTDPVQRLLELRHRARTANPL